MIILALLLVLFFSISSISAQSVNNSDDLDDKILKSSSSSNGATTKNISTKAKTDSTKKTSTNNTITSKRKENTTTMNRKTLAKTSTSFMNYVEKNGKFPKVKISNKNYSNTEYLYLMTKAVENNSNSKIEIRRNLVKKYNNTNSKSVKGTLNKTEYVKIASKTRKFIDKNKRAPNWVSSSKGNIPYNQLILSYSKCLDFFNKNNRLPNSIRLDDLDLDKINSKIIKNKTKTTANSIAKTKQTVNKTANKTTSTTVKTNASKTKDTTKNTVSNKEDKSSKDTSLVEKTLNSIHNILNNILDRLDPSRYKVDVTKSDDANVKFNTSKINVDINGKSTVNVKVSAKNTTKTTTKKTPASNTKTNATKTSVSKIASKTVSSNKSSISAALKKYLTSSKNCQVKNKAIQDLAKTLTSEIKSDFEKGKKLFNWVRDNIQYKKYRNTRRGAVKTLQTKKGNCVDQSHLLIALSRASGIPARYVKGGNCKFSNGYVSGHIWTQMYINNKWVVADTTSHRNSLGKIKNWNTKNYKLYGQFRSINF